MTLIHAEGFGIRQDVDYFNNLYDTVTGTFSSASTPSRKRLTGGIDVTRFSIEKRVVASGTEDTLIVQFCLQKRNTTAIGANTPGIYFSNDDGEQAALLFEDPPGSQDAGHFIIKLVRGATTIATSEVLIGAAATQRSWHAFQLSITMTNTGAYNLRHWDYENNQSTIFSDSGVDLQEQTSSGAHTVKFELGSSLPAPTWRLCDFFIMDTNGSFNNAQGTTPLVAFEMLPGIDGNQTDWSRSSGAINADLVDDPSTSLNTNDRVSSSDVGDIDLYTYGDPAEMPASPTIRAVAVTTDAEMENSGARTLKVRVRSGSNEAAGAAFSPTTTLQAFQTIFEQNPTGTPANWTKSDVDGVELGIEVDS